MDLKTGLSIASPILTLGLLIVTFFYLRATQKLVQSTREQLKQTWQPILVYEREIYQMSKKNLELHYIISNVGHGPALDVHIFFPKDFLSIQGKKELNEEVLTNVRVLGNIRPGNTYDIAIVNKDIDNIEVSKVDEYIPVLPALCDGQVLDIKECDFSLAFTYTDIYGERRWTKCRGDNKLHFQQETGTGEI